MNTGGSEKNRCNVADVNEEPGWCKDEPVVYKEGDKHFCVFHSPAAHKGIPIEEFNQLIFKKLNDALEKDEECDLFLTVFPGEICFRAINQEGRLPLLELTGAEFLGKADFSRVKFSKTASFFDAKFAQCADFYDAEFGGWADFQFTTFGSEALFISIKFLENATFHDAKFEKKAYFRSTQFRKDVEFYNTKFGGDSYFTNVIFWKDADFHNASFGKNDADFSDADFKGISNFKEATFKGHVKLGVKFNKAYFFNDTFLGMVAIYGLTIEDEIRFKDVNLGNVLFHGAEMERMRFEHCIWSESKSEGRIVILDEKEIANKGDDKKIREVEEIYRTLKQKYKDMGNEGTASSFHLSEKTMLTMRTHFKDSPFFWALLKLYKLSNGYGEYPSRAFNVLLILLIASILALWLAGLRATSNEPVSIFQAALTTVEFLTFQRETHYGLKTATGFAGIIRVISTILVYVQTLLLIFAMRNRLRR